MAEYKVFQAHGETAEKYRDICFEEYNLLKNNIAAMKEAGQETFLVNPDDFQSNKHGLLANMDVFIQNDAVLFIDFEGGKAPKGFEPVETVTIPDKPSGSKMKPHNPRS